MVPSIHAPPRLPPGRSAAQLRDEMQAVALALHAGLSPEDAASLMPTASFVALRGHGRRSHTDPRFVYAVHAVVDSLPKHLLLHLPTALRRIPYEQRLALLLIVVYEFPRQPAAEALGVSAKTVQRYVDAALQALAELLWDNDGHAQAVAPPRR